MPEFALEMIKRGECFSNNPKTSHDDIVSSISFDDVTLCEYTLFLLAHYGWVVFGRNNVCVFIRNNFYLFQSAEA